MGWVFRNTGQVHVPLPYPLGPTPLPARSCHIDGAAGGHSCGLAPLLYLHGCGGQDANVWVGGWGKLRGSPEEEAFIHLPVVAELLPCLIPSALLCEVPKALCRPRQAEGVEEPTWKEALRLFAERLGSLQTSYVISSVRKGCFSFSFLMDHFLEQFLFHGKK